MKSKSTKILYTYTDRMSFVRKDIIILEKYYEVTTYQFKTDVKSLTPLSYFLQAVYLLLNGWKFDAFIMFFSGYHSLLPAIFARLTNKKCIIFLGGTDCFNYPSFNYGNFTKKWYGKATCISAHQASLLIPVSENLTYSKSDYYNGDSKEQGIYHWCAPLKVPYAVIPLEYDPEIFYRHDVVRVSNSFISVAFGIEGSSFVRKGIDKMIMVAGYFPQYQFTIIGCHPKDFPVPVPENVNLIPPVKYEELPFHYSKHQFYVQLSIVEGFPSAICEGMLCECIPIGSNVAAIPLIVGDHGFLVGERNDELIIDTVRKALAFPDKEKKGKAAREHIIANYGPGKRISALKDLLAAQH